MNTPQPDASYAAVARQSINQAVLSANGQPFFARQASEIVPRLYISDVFTARKLESLRELSITHIVTVMDHIVLFPIELEVKTLHVRVDDLPSSDLLSKLHKTTDFITDALKDENARVLVHCWQGVSRSASVAAAYLIARENMTTDAAVELLKSKRRIVQPNIGFLRQLKQYEILVRADDGSDHSTK